MRGPKNTWESGGDNVDVALLRAPREPDVEFVQLRLLLHLDPLPDRSPVLPLGQLREVQPQQALNLRGCQALGGITEQGLGLGRQGWK